MFTGEPAIAFHVGKVFPEALAKVGAVMVGLPSPLVCVRDLRKEFFLAVMAAHLTIVQAPNTASTQPKPKKGTNSKNTKKACTKSSAQLQKPVGNSCTNSVVQPEPLVSVSVPMIVTDGGILEVDPCRAPIEHVIDCSLLPTGQSSWTGFPCGTPVPSGSATPTVAPAPIRTTPGSQKRMIQSSLAGFVRAKSEG